MPNWCNNSITITGPGDKIRALWEAAKTKDGLLEAMVPIGEWKYDTAVDSWGTKWDVSMEGLELEEYDNGTAAIAGWFDSAWAPPLAAFATFCGANEDCDITASYYEMGMDFGGFWSVEHGDEYLENLHEVWENDPELELFKRLDDEYDLTAQFEEWEEDYAEE